MQRIAKKAAIMQHVTQQMKPQEKVVEKPEEDLDLDDSYEDDVFQVFFNNKVELLAYSTQIEDDNLFKIGLVQDEEHNLEKMKT